jgi:hypothetical protein
MNRKQRRGIAKQQHSTAESIEFETMISPLVASAFSVSPGLSINDANGDLSRMIHDACLSLVRGGLGKSPDGKGIAKCRTLYSEDITILVDIGQKKIVVFFSSEHPERVPDDDNLVCDYTSTSEEWEAKKQQFRALRH